MKISPLFSKKFRILRKIFKILPFPEKFLDFHPPKFDDFFLVIDHKFRISPFFAVSVHFPPVSRKLLFPPTLTNFLPLFYTNSSAFYLLYVYFVSPYFYHDAFIHPMHVLDASGHLIDASASNHPFSGLFLLYQQLFSKG